MNDTFAKIEDSLKQGEWFRVLFLGDSITSTEWVHPNWRNIIEYVLKSEMEKSLGEWEAPNWKMRFYNAGYNGVRTREIIDLIDEDVALFQPNLIIFMDTYNDIYRQISPEDHAKNLELIFDKLLRLTDDIYFSTSVPGINRQANEKARPYIEAANGTVAALDTPVKTIDLFDEFKDYDLFRFFTFISENGNEDAGVEPGELDYAHPNPLGNAVIAKHFLKTIFNINFNPDTYIREQLSGIKYPAY